MPRIEVAANELKDVRVNFVSLVKRGANRIPFRVTKGEDPMPLDLSTFFRKHETEADAVSKAEEEKTSDLAHARKLLEEAGYRVEKTAGMNPENGQPVAAAAPGENPEVDEDDKRHEAEEVANAPVHGEQGKAAMAVGKSDHMDDKKKMTAGEESAEDDEDDVDEKMMAKKADRDPLVKMDELIQAMETRLLKQFEQAIAPLGDRVVAMERRLSKAEGKAEESSRRLTTLVSAPSPEDMPGYARKSAGPSSIPPIDTAFMRVR